MNISPEDWAVCLKVLQQISYDPSVINEEERIKGLIAKIHREGKKGHRRAAQRRQEAEDRSLKAAAGVVQVNRGGQPSPQEERSGEPQAAALQASKASLPGPTLPEPQASATGTCQSLNRPTRCYICKGLYTQIHFFYHLLCPACAAFNYAKRSQRADLRGRVALLTGGRVKIGHQVALRMLRDGARVLVTTRFPQDCARRFNAERDFDCWRDRLGIIGLDLRHIPAVEALARHLLDTETSLDILIHNAAQTIKRPLGFYQHLLAQEQFLDALPAGAKSLILKDAAPHTPLLECLPHYPSDPAANSAYFPLNIFDSEGQQLDLRPTNSWRLRLGEVSTIEMLEVQLVNAVAPFILNSQLKPLLMRSSFLRRFIVNVSAMEGEFSRADKTAFHPHTNMAKAALNMMTRTSAADYARDGIFMNSVDTGWITDENPYPKKIHLQERRGFYTPLDIIDGMARIYDPIVQGIEQPGEPLHGHFLKDYSPHPW